MRLRYRVDGVLLDAIPATQADAARAGLAFQDHVRLDIAERRLPQDGRMRRAVSGKTLTCASRCCPPFTARRSLLRVPRQDQPLRQH